MIPSAFLSQLRHSSGPPGIPEQSQSPIVAPGINSVVEQAVTVYVSKRRIPPARLSPILGETGEEWLRRSRNRLGMGLPLCPWRCRGDFRRSPRVSERGLPHLRNNDAGNGRAVSGKSFGVFACERPDVCARGQLNITEMCPAAERLPAGTGDCARRRALENTFLCQPRECSSMRRIRKRPGS